jgi:hypothetical protein
MQRDPAKAAELPDPKREAVGLPVGRQGEYFVGATGFYGQDADDSVTDYNGSGVQPGLWCHWAPNETGETLAWDGGEKFYDYLEWLAYLVRHFLSPWGHRLNGQVEWQGEEPGDRGLIIARDNVLSSRYAVEAWGEERPIS